MSRTQLRLQQLTGSAVDIKTEVANYITPVAAASLTGSDLQDVIGAMAAAIQRIHGKTGNEVFNQTQGVFDVNAQINGTITATGNADFQGDVDLGDATSDSITVTGRLDSDVLPIAQSTHDLGSAALAFAQVHATNYYGTGSFASAAIGDLTDNQIVIAGASGELEGDANLTFDGTFLGVTGSVRIKGEGGDLMDIDAVEAITIDSSAGISIGAGAASDFTTTAGALTLEGRTGVNIKENGTDVIVVDNSRAVNIGVSGQATTVKGTLNVDEAASFDSTVLISGDLTVLGSATEISSSNTIIKDALIVLNSSSYGDGTPIEQDAGIIFAQPDVSRALFVDTSESGDPFRFVTTYTSGSATSVTPLGDANVTMGGLTATGITDSSITNQYVVFSNSGVLTGEAEFKWTGDDLVLGNDHGIVFGDTGEKIEGNGTDLFVNSSARLLLSASTDVHIPQSKGLAFAHDGAEKIQGDGTDLTINSGGKINLTATSDVHIPEGVGLVFDTAGTENIESDGSDLTIKSGGDIILNADGADIRLKDDTVEFGKFVKDGSSLVVSSSLASITFASNDRNFSFKSVTAATANSLLTLDLPENAGEGVQFSTQYKENLILSASAGLVFGSQHILDSSFTSSSFGLIGLSNTAAEFNTFATNFSNDASIIGAINTAYASATGGDLDKAVLHLTASLASGSQLKLDGTTVNVAPVLLGTDGFSISGISNPNLRVETYVNGQLLLSGSDADVGAGNADYLFDTNTSVKFGFGLEIDDVVQLIKR